MSADDIQAELERLSQAKRLTEISRELGLTELITVYLSDAGKDHTYGFYSAFVPSAKIEDSLGSDGWDLNFGDGVPGAVRRCFDALELEQQLVGLVAVLERLLLGDEAFAQQLQD